MIAPFIASASSIANARMLGLAIMLILVAACSPAKPDFIAQEFDLENGAKLIVLPDHRWPILTHMVWYRVGAGDEAQSKTGLAHFLEHLMFSSQPSTKSFSEKIHDLGGYDNAFTSYDYTAYFQRVHPSHLERVMQLEAKRMAQLTLGEGAARKERKIVIEEYHTRLDSDPLAKLQQKMRQALYGADHP